MVDITGIDKGALLAELFNNSQAMGMGVLQAGRGPEIMSAEKGRSLIEAAKQGSFSHDTNMMFGMRHGPALYFDYLFGRPLKVDLSGDEIDPWGYDRDNGGPGTLAAIVAKLRSAALNKKRRE